MTDSLPDDVWNQILLMLPVQTLLICMCVCKSWNSYIKHPRFIDAHLRRKRSDLLMVRTFTKGGDNDFFSFHVDDNTFNEHIKREFPLTRLFPYGVVGSCNGVLCLTNDVFGLLNETYLWNPMLRRTVVVPYTEITSTSLPPAEFDQLMGFGFDENTNDYKVVRVIEFIKSSESLQVKLFSMGTGNWKDLSHLVSNTKYWVQVMPSRTTRQAYLNGVAHWLVKERGPSFTFESYRLMVLAFHFGDEVLRTIEPPIKMSRLSKALWLDNVKGSLSLFEHKDERCCLWVLKDYGVPSTWTKLFDISLSPDVDQVIGFRKEGELLIGIRGGLYSFDPKKEPDFLSESNRSFWNFFQGDYLIGYHFGDDVHSYDPEAAPKELKFQSRTRINYSFQSESYTESLVFLGAIMSLKDDQVPRIHEEVGNNK